MRQVVPTGLIFGSSGNSGKPLNWRAFSWRPFRGFRGPPGTGLGGVLRDSKPALQGRHVGRFRGPRIARRHCPERPYGA